MNKSKQDQQPAGVLEVLELGAVAHREPDGWLRARLLCFGTRKRAGREKADAVIDLQQACSCMRGARPGWYIGILECATEQFVWGSQQPNADDKAAENKLARLRNVE